MLMYFRLDCLVRGAVVMNLGSYADLAAVHTLDLINLQIVNCVAKVVSVTFVMPASVTLCADIISDKIEPGRCDRSSRLLVAISNFCSGQHAKLCVTRKARTYPRTGRWRHAGLSVEVLTIALHQTVDIAGQTYGV